MWNSNEALQRIFWRQKVLGALNIQSNNRATMTSASIPLVDLSEDNEVSVVTRWDIELRKKGSYKIAASILSGRKFGAPCLAVMREWLDVILHQPFQDLFLNNSEQARPGAMGNLMVCRQGMGASVTRFTVTACRMVVIARSV
jgi:hypothetical protein